MSSGAIGGLGAAAVADASRNRFSELSSKQFIQILITELTAQDSFKPTDSTALMEQLRSIRNIESQLSLQEHLESLVVQNQVAQTSGMIGQVVEGLDTLNTPVKGQVTSVRVSDGKAILDLDTGRSLAMNRVTRIFEHQVGEGSVLDPLLWDFNKDGEVDLTDESYWNNTWRNNANKARPTEGDGEVMPPSFREGDFNGDGAVDQKDFDLLEERFAPIRAVSYSHQRRREVSFWQILLPCFECSSRRSGRFPRPRGARFDLRSYPWSHAALSRCSTRHETLKRIKGHSVPHGRRDLRGRHRRKGASSTPWPALTRSTMRRSGSC